MDSLNILALAGKPVASVLDALPHLLGMLMVMVTLFVLWGVCALTGKLIQRVSPALEAASTVIRNTPVPTVLEVPSPETIAIIAAAVASVVSSSHRIISIRRPSSTWEKVGRQSVLTSHRIR